MKSLMYTMLFLLVAAVVFAAKDNPETQDTNNLGGKNMTFGQCVSAAAQEKNTCFENAETQRKTCENGNETSTCKSSYKQMKNECKKEFKTAKKECGKIKHSAWDGFKASFK
jgi:hypothetical protein